MMRIAMRLRAGRCVPSDSSTWPPHRAVPCSQLRGSVVLQDGCPSRSTLHLAHRLAQERPEFFFVDVGALADLDVAHEFAFALEESVRILQCGAAEEAELHVVG